MLWHCWLGGRKGIRPVKTERWGAGVVICLERGAGADLHTAQLMPLPLTVSCFSKIQIGFAFLVPAHPGSPGQRAVKRVCVCVCGTQQCWPCDLLGLPNTYWLISELVHVHVRCSANFRVSFGLGKTVIYYIGQIGSQGWLWQTNRQTVISRRYRPRSTDSADEGAAITDSFSRCLMLSLGSTAVSR